MNYEWLSWWPERAETLSPMTESGGDPYKTSIPATLFFEVVVKIIAFDIGANFAWAVNHPKVAWHSIELKGIRAHRQQQLLNYLESLSWVKKLDAAIYETPIAVGQSAKRSLSLPMRADHVPYWECLDGCGR